ncbi:lipoprotein [Actinophytocola sp.]|uniref:lipoprotein n=1 Tax=Actinophytocola sp. TaxID=1872138 RepID=UPI002D7F7C1B|nr:lipoprotein [Actinophytocola sp.]HET9143612.1 lipoprotein [Actinophytocola sp.]
MRATVGLAAIVLMLTLAGCGEDEPDAGAGPWSDGMQPAAAATKIGAGDPCPLPVTMDVADKWLPKSVEAGTFRQGDLDLVCEIDAKPAGPIGFIRVWTGAAQPRAALEAYVADQKDTSEVSYRDTEVGSGSGAEVIWKDGESGRKRAFAAPAPGGVVVVVVGGIDDEEYQALLPAYLLAKKTIT